KLLVHIATGPENPTRLTLGLLVARTALAEGHSVDVFVAGDGVDVLRAETRSAVQGVGTGSAEEHWQALREGGARLFGSGLSSKARGVAPGDDDGVQLAPPDMLVRLIAEADRIVSY
ncbi:MAG TPA: DsrE family protein, partial [Candidatus Limnocylindria bacterium]|nr:DsrE family protein [Candidatus Limnocylindria bacterium]